MPIDSRGRPRGLAFITYISHDMAANAVNIASKGIRLGQRKLRVEVFKPLETLEKERGIEKDPKDGEISPTTALKTAALVQQPTD